MIGQLVKAVAGKQHHHIGIFPLVAKQMDCWEQGKVLHLCSNLGFTHPYACLQVHLGDVFVDIIMIHMIFRDFSELKSTNYTNNKNLEAASTQFSGAITCFILFSFFDK